MARTKLTDEVEAPGTVWAEHRDRYPDDSRLRQHGYKIHSRKNGQEPIWELGGNLVPQHVALQRISE